MILAAILFWGAVALILYTHLGYAIVLRVLVALRRRATLTPGSWEELPKVSLVIAAYDDEEVIVATAGTGLALDYPCDRLEVSVASGGSGGATAGRPRAAGADLVLELPRGGKIAAQNAAVEQASGALVAFSGADSISTPDALRRLI